MVSRALALQRSLASRAATIAALIVAGIVVAAILFSVLSSISGAAHLAPTRWIDSAPLT